MSELPRGFVQIEKPSDEQSVKVGVLGYQFIARAHVNAYKTIPYTFNDVRSKIDLRAISGTAEDAVALAARRYGFLGYYLNWEDLVSDPNVDLFDNCGPHSLHVEPTIAAIEAGKNVLCEKPLALSSGDALRVVQAARSSPAVHMVGFNYRFVPAVQLAQSVIRRNLLGELHHLRIAYLQQGHRDARRPLSKPVRERETRAGAQASLGSHIVDLARFLIGEIASVSSVTGRISPTRIGPSGGQISVEWDDATLSLVQFENGTVGTVEASRVATGHRNVLRFEIDGSQGSLGFDLERINELRVSLDETPSAELTGTTRVLVTETSHPYGDVWWPPGHVIGWEHTQVNQLHHLLRAIEGSSSVEPLGATLEDGYRAAVVADAMAESSLSGRRQSVQYEV